MGAGEPADRDKREWATVRRIACLAAEEKQMLASPAATRLRMRSLQVQKLILSHAFTACSF